MKKKKDIAREMRQLAMDLGVREFYVYVDLGFFAFAFAFICCFLY